MNTIFQLLGIIAVQADGAKETIDEVTASAKGLASTLGATSDEADKTGTTMNKGGKLSSGFVWLGNMATKATETLLRIGKGIASTGFSFNASMEAYQIQFEAILGSADKASGLVADLQKLAKISPLGMEGLANNAVSLLNTGVELQDIIPTLEMLGNLSLGDTNKMNSIVRAYTQILSKGQLMAQEMYQLGDAGVPINRIMTLYGGEEYADGSWYSAKMSDPTYKIMAEDMVAAFKAATSEGGEWHDRMSKMMTSLNGQTDRMGEEGKETLGGLFSPFFDVAKSDVLPKLTESLSQFGVWVENNKEALTSMAEAVGGLVTGGFDMMLGAFEWIVDHEDSLPAALTAVGTALGVCVAQAHPLAAALATIMGALMYIDENGVVSSAGGDLYDEKGKLIDQTITPFMKQVYTPEDLVRMGYDHMKVEAEFGLEEGSLAAVQAEVENLDLKARVKLYPEVVAGFTSFYAGPTEGKGISYHVDASGDKAGGTVGQGFATGLDYVPYNDFPARLHVGEAVLTREDASAWRSGRAEEVTVLANRLESAMMRLEGIMQQVAANTAMGHVIALDTGAVVGQTVRQMDTELGNIATRKGRRN